MLGDYRPGREIASGDADGFAGGPLLVEALDCTPGPRRRRGYILAPGLAVAVLLHGAIAWALVVERDGAIGAGGIDLEAISVEVSVVSATAIESRAPSQSVEPASRSAIDQSEGASVASAAVPEIAPSEVVPPESATPEKSLPDAVPLETSPIDTKTEASEPAAQPAPAPVEPPAPALAVETFPHPPEPASVTWPDRQQKSVPEAIQPAVARTPDTPSQSEQPHFKPERQLPEGAAPSSRSSTAMPAGGAASRAADGKNRPARSAAAASQGAIEAFTKGVVGALARTRPKSTSARSRGTARVAFAIADGGRLEFVRVTRSAGSERLDAAAVAAVRKARFPAPPPGLTLQQRTYEVPYHFR
jgi:protein TonB